MLKFINGRARQTWQPPLTSNWTGRTNRTMHDAFGLHTSRYICEPAPPTPAWHAWAYAVVCLAAVVAIAVMLSTGV